MRTLANLLCVYCLGRGGTEQVRICQHCELTCCEHVAKPRELRRINEGFDCSIYCEDCWAELCADADEAAEHAEEFTS